MSDIDTSDESANQEEAVDVAAAPSSDQGGRAEPTNSEADHPGRRRHLVVLALVVALAAAGGGTWWFLNKDDLGDDIAFRAYETEVPKAAVAEQSRTLHALYGVEVPTKPAVRAKYNRDLAKSMALARVMDRTAKELKVTVSDDEAQTALKQYIKQYYGEGTGGRSAFVAALGTEGTSEPAVRRELGRQILVSRLYEQVTKSVREPTAAQVSAAYKARSCELKLPEQRRLSNIVTATREQAQAALDKIKNGRTFASVAQTDSADQSTSAKGGDLGLVGRQQLEKAYADAAWTTRTGQLFGPVQTRYGWNVGQVVKIEPALVPSEAKSASVLADVLLTEARSKVWQSWIHERLKKAEVEYAAAYEPADPFAAPKPAGTTSKAECD